MTKREIQKKNTREFIIKTAKHEFIKKGFLKATTADIALRAGLAHGTLFLHFNTKDELIIEIVEDLLVNITNDLHDLLKSAKDVEELLNNYLECLSKEEQFFTILSRELPFYTPKLRRQIIFRESGIRKYFYEAIEKGIKNGNYKNIEISDSLNFLFGHINYLLSNKELFIKSGSVIAQKRNSIINTFLSFIKK